MAAGGRAGATPPTPGSCPIRRSWRWLRCCASLEMFDEVGMDSLRQRSIRLTGYLEALLDELIGDRPIKIITPRDPARRGAQLSVRLPGGSVKQITTGCGCEHGVIADAREPDVDPAGAGAAVRHLSRLLAGRPCARRGGGRQWLSDRPSAIVGAGLAGSRAGRATRPARHRGAGVRAALRPAGERRRTRPFHQPGDLRARAVRAASRSGSARTRWLVRCRCAAGRCTRSLVTRCSSRTAPRPAGDQLDQPIRPERGAARPAPRRPPASGCTSSTASPRSTARPGR